MRKKRLMIIINSLSMGGAERMVLELVKNLNSNILEVQVICTGEKLNNDLEMQMEKITNVKYLNINGKVGINKLLKVLHIISKNKPDIIHAHLGGIAFALPWSIIHKKPLLITAHTTPEKAFTPKVEKILRKHLNSKNIKIVAVSSDNQIAMQKYFGIDNEKCVYVNNGIDINKFYQKEHQDFTFINVARHDENKNQAIIIKCFKRILQTYPNCKLILAGDGPTHQQLIKQAEDCKQIIFTGLVNNSMDYYAISDCYIQSSHREALPLSVLEAMATGLPIIATNVGGLKDVVSDKNGKLILDDDEDALFKAMETFLSLSLQEREQYGLESKKIVKNYSSIEMANKYLDIYKEMIS